jgi:hypothetical protein
MQVSSAGITVFFVLQTAQPQLTRSASVLGTIYGEVLARNESYCRTKVPFLAPSVARTRYVKGNGYTATYGYGYLNINFAHAMR